MSVIPNDTIEYNGESEEEFNAKIKRNCRKDYNPKPPRGEIICRNGSPIWMRTRTHCYYGWAVIDERWIMTEKQCKATYVEEIEANGETFQIFERIEGDDLVLMIRQNWKILIGLDGEYRYNRRFRNIAYRSMRRRLAEYIMANKNPTIQI